MESEKKVKFIKRARAYEPMLDPLTRAKSLSALEIKPIPPMMNLEQELFIICRISDDGNVHYWTSQSYREAIGCVREMERHTKQAQENGHKLQTEYRLFKVFIPLEMEGK